VAILVLMAFIVIAFVVGGFIVISKKLDNWPIFILIGILICMPVLFYLWLFLFVLITGGIGGTPPGWQMIIILLLLLALLVITMVAIGIILKRIIKTIIKTMTKQKKKDGFI